MILGRARFGEQNTYGPAAAQRLFQNNELGIRQVEELAAREPANPGCRTWVDQHVADQGPVSADNPGTGGCGEHDSSGVLDDGDDQRTGPTC